MKSLRIGVGFSGAVSLNERVDADGMVERGVEEDRGSDEAGTATKVPKSSDPVDIVRPWFVGRTVDGGWEVYGDTVVAFGLFA